MDINLNQRIMPQVTGINHLPVTIHFGFLFVIIFCISLFAGGQTLPDSIVITKNIYINNKGIDSFQRSDRYSLLHIGENYFLKGKKISKSKVRGFVTEIQKRSNGEHSFKYFGIDTNWIKSNPADVLKLYADKNEFEWNFQQKKFIFNELSKINAYRDELNDYLSIGCCYSIHNSYRNEFVIQVYKQGQLVNTIKSRKYAGGFKQPWTNEKNDTLYNMEIENKLDDLLSMPGKTMKPLYGKKLLRHFVNNIVDSKLERLYELSAYTYINEIEELKSDFEILTFNEVAGRGRYIWDEPKTIRVMLKNKQMLDNVYLLFLASAERKSIYTRDSLKKDYNTIIDRIQSIKFITSYIQSYPKSRLDIYYFNNKGINEYNIDGINKNPSEWIKYDQWMENLNLDSLNNISPDFNDHESIKISRQVHCGCNYRFDRSYLEKAIFFEIIDEDRNRSIWFLLPDNKVLLYLMHGDKVLNYSYKDFGGSNGLQYPCRLFDAEGSIIKK